MTIHAVLACVTILALTAPAQAEQAVREIRFPPNKASATVSDAVVRGERHLWTFNARAGQQAAVSVTATENNAVFQIWQPGARVSMARPQQVEGETLPGAGEEHDARRWRGRLPQSGSYLVVVGPRRGNATYRLTVAVKP